MDQARPSRATISRHLHRSYLWGPGDDHLGPYGDFPSEWPVACRNPVLAADRARTGEELLAATEKLVAPLSPASRPASSPAPW